VACGMRGGRRIVSVVAQICQRLVDYGWTGRQAVTAPRLHVEMQEPVEVTDSLSPAVVEKLRALGHVVSPMPKSTYWANAAERLSDGRLRASGDVWAAAVNRGAGDRFPSPAVPQATENDGLRHLRRSRRAG